MAGNLTAKLRARAELGRKLSTMPIRAGIIVPFLVNNSKRITYPKFSEITAPFKTWIRKNATGFAHAIIHDNDGLRAEIHLFFELYADREIFLQDHEEAFVLLKRNENEII
jgi:hypothetical protein